MVSSVTPNMLLSAATRTLPFCSTSSVKALRRSGTKRGGLDFALLISTIPFLCSPNPAALYVASLHDRCHAPGMSGFSKALRESSRISQGLQEPFVAPSRRAYPALIAVRLRDAFDADTWGRCRLDDRIEVYHRLPRVAYFCMEYGLSPRLPLYAGGLGILAGDLIKSAHDLQLPLTAVGILWREGYSEQHLDHEGRPYDTAVTWNPHERLNGHLIEAGQCEVQVRGETVPLKIWRVSGFGNAPLYLLDADVPGSPHNWITRQLYAGGSYDRIAQEIVLGVGGVRALRALGIEVDVYHFNEGHAVFAGLELIRELREAGSGFEEAWRAARERIIFTTHTPVAAGNETHSHDLLFQLGAPLGLSYDEMVRIGGDPFNMT